MLELFKDDQYFGSKSAAEIDLAAECARAAELLSSLRFYEVSAKLFESAYLQKPEVLRYAVLTFASLKKVDDLGEIFRFKSFVESVETGAILSPNKKPLERLFRFKFPGSEEQTQHPTRELTKEEKLDVISQLRPADYWTWGAAPDTRENFKDNSDPRQHEHESNDSLPPI
jgi:hypothetical protein